ncbi:DNA-directed RNA polymerase subunit beta [Bacillus salacetis]|uniref:DNA-directed RNA polymerase subunit beta n=1 Tax=Bacillus salacetis TaxID=2315464 RepID=A0A3A1R223_9BACI|nr:DNA-directed RNA polymerase subunit beta [Bacillus salacetis]RIW36107.1 DNA-directed RNA polymerase subunit beta [Bacillus salacetis]
MTEKQILQEEGKTREEIKAEKKNKKNRAEEKPGKWVRIRVLPIWLRIILFVVLLAGCVIGGAMFGYGVIGDGKPMDVLDKSTWQHIIDIVKKEQ